MVEDGDGAALGVADESLRSHCSCVEPATSDMVAIENHDVPEAEVEAVPALARSPARRSPIVPICRAAGRPRVDEPIAGRVRVLCRPHDGP